MFLSVFPSVGSSVFLCLFLVAFWFVLSLFITFLLVFLGLYYLVFFSAHLLIDILSPALLLLALWFLCSCRRDSSFVHTCVPLCLEFGPLLINLPGSQFSHFTESDTRQFFSMKFVHSPWKYFVPNTTSKCDSSEMYFTLKGKRQHNVTFDLPVVHQATCISQRTQVLSCV